MYYFGADTNVGTSLNNIYRNYTTEQEEVNMVNPLPDVKVTYAGQEFQPTIVTDTKDLSREQWLDLRMNGLGGSDASVILGFNNWKSPFQLYIEKTTFIPQEETDNEFIYWGNVLEDVVAQEFAKRTGKEVYEDFKMLAHPEYPFMTANLDRRIVGENAFLECKTTSAYKMKDWDGDQVPAAYLIQIQHYMAVTGFDKCYIAVLIGGNHFVHKEIERDQELIDMIIQAEKGFWENHVMAKEPPEIDGSAAAKEFINNKYAIDDGSEIYLGADVDVTLEALDAVKAEIKALEVAKTKYENDIKLQMKQSEKAVTKGYEVKYKTQVSNRIDTKRLKQEQPELYKQYVKESTSRKFTYKPLEG